MFERYKVIHLVGIGGIGMSGIAEVLYNLGYDVRGSDISESDTVERLRVLGVEIFKGHRPENVDGAHVVVISSAIGRDNPEVLEAERRGVPVISRAEMLAELGRLKYSVLVAGSHGKTTTTSLISTILAHGGLDPTVVIGGKLKALGTNARLGRGDFMVAEADESDGSFLKLIPTVGVVTNIDMEHMDYFTTMKALKEAFVSFMNRVPFYGVTVACIDDKNVREILPSVARRVITYGLSKDADLRAKNVRKGFMSMDFEALAGKESLGRLSIPSPGEHSVLNALAATAVALELQVDIKQIKEALAGFGGIQRRLELKGKAKGVSVFDDYGHHPTEIRATLRALSESVKKGRLVVVFQPHRYSRTKLLMDEFASSFGDADLLVMMDIYPAGEKPIKGIKTEALIEKMKGRKGIFHARSAEEAVERLQGELRSGDVVLTLGAGNVWKVGDLLLETLKSKK
jgi:UDP-N-acetylmuramate--alanine ligase